MSPFFARPAIEPDMALPAVALAAPEDDDAADRRLVELAPPAQPGARRGGPGDVIADAGLAKAPRDERTAPGGLVVGRAQARRLLVADDPWVVLRATDLLLAQLGGGELIPLGRHRDLQNEKEPAQGGLRRR